MNLVASFWWACFGRVGGLWSVLVCPFCIICNNDGRFLAEYEERAIAGRICCKRSELGEIRLV